MTFQIHALPADHFEPLFAMSDAELADHNAKRITVTETPGFPCRVTLRDADVGETVILANYTHLPVASPYRSCHAVYVRENASRAEVPTGQVPDVILSRLTSLRLFDANDMMIDADVVVGEDMEEALTRAFQDSRVVYAHLHNARQGCFHASATRA